MEKEFIPYEQALALKELGFDEPCCARYYYEVKDNKLMFFQPNYAKDFNFTTINLTGQKNNDKPLFVSVPTFSQAFRWFREKYKIFPYTYTGNGNLFHYCMFIKDRDNQYHSNQLYLSNEEAELECLKKLIEIVK
jgi:hypothetical protein